MIEIKEAVKIVIDHFHAMYTQQSVSEMLLEEVEHDEEHKQWVVTLSFDWVPVSGSASIGPGDRRYKSFRLDQESGRMVTLKSSRRSE